MKTFDENLNDEQKAEAVRLRHNITTGGLTLSEKYKLLVHEGKREAKIKDLRAKLQIEYAFRDLTDQDKEFIRSDLLAKIGFDKEKPMWENDYYARVLFHQDHNDMAYNERVLTHFVNLIRSGHNFTLKLTKRYRSCYASILDDKDNLASFYIDY